MDDLEKVLREMPIGNPEMNLFARRAAPTVDAYKFVSEWFDDETTTESFLCDAAKAGFRVVRV